MKMIPFEEENCEAYRLLLRIEICLRELLKNAYEQREGASWRKKLPGDMLNGIRASERDESKRPQFDYLRLGPLYYITFGDLLMLLNQKNNVTAIACLGGEVFVNQFTSIINLRNSLAHSRSVSRTGLMCIKSLYAQMETALTPEGFAQLIAHPDIGIRPEDAIPVLTNWLIQIEAEMKHIAINLPEEPMYQKANVQYWWGTKELAGFDCSVIDTAAQFLKSYNMLPNGLGSAAVKQRLIDELDGKLIIVNAIKALRQS